MLTLFDIPALYKQGYARQKEPNDAIEHRTGAASINMDGIALWKMDPG